MRNSSAIMQAAFVVDDVRAAAQRWAKDMGIGPFFVQDHVRYRSLTYRGEPCAADVSLAFAFSGDMQIELVCQHNDTPSIYRDAVAAHGYGAQHLGKVVADLPGELAQFARRGIAPVQHGVSEDGVETVFLPFQSGPAGIIELIQGSEALTQIFAFMKATAADWDGHTAIYS